MTTHRNSTRRFRLTSARSRALASLGAVVALATGLSVHGTFALWTDTATIQTGSFNSGTLDITVSGQLTGQGGSYTNTALALDTMEPGESMSTSFPVANAGTSPLNYTISGSAGGTLAPYLTFTLYNGTAVANTGTAAAGNRAGTCGGSVIVAATTLTATPATLGAARPLAKAASENICVVVSLPSATPNAAQGLTTTATLVFNATQ